MYQIIVNHPPYIFTSPETLSRAAPNPITHPSFINTGLISRFESGQIEVNLTEYYQRGFSQFHIRQLLRRIFLGFENFNTILQREGRQT